MTDRGWRLDMASSGMRGQHAWSDMVSGITPSTGSGRTLFSVEEAMIVNMDLPLRAGDEESPESQRDLHVKTETIYFFICFLLLLFGKKKEGFPASRFIGFVLFPVVLVYTFRDIRTCIISNKFSQIITPGWNTERLDVEWVGPVATLLFELIYLYEGAYGQSPKFTRERAFRFLTGALFNLMFFVVLWTEY